MKDIKWCLKAKNGIELIEPNDNLSKLYMKKATNSLEVSRKLKKSKEWGISTSYYSMYFSLYSILMKIGIRSEIHSCTVELMRLLTDYFTVDDYSLLKNSQKARIDSQYYVDRAVSDALYERMKKMAPVFLVKCKEILLKLNNNEITRIRKIIKDKKRGG